MCILCYSYSSPSDIRKVPRVKFCVFIYYIFLVVVTAMRNIEMLNKKAASKARKQTE